MIVFKNINITSFKSIFSVNLDFSKLNNNFYFLEGINNTVNFAESNGAGKSTLCDAISFALYGTTNGLYIKNEEYENKNSNLPLKIILDFDIITSNSTNSYKITRTLKTLSIQENNIDISALTKTETEKKLKDILNLTQNEFFSFTYLTQSSNNFLSKTASEKLAILKDFIFGEELLDVKSKLDNLLKTYKLDISKFENEISKLEGNIESLKSILQNNTDENKTEITKEEYNNIKNEKFNLEEKLKQYTTLETEKRNLEIEYNKLKIKIAEIKNKYAKICEDKLCPLCGQTIQNDEHIKTEIKKEADLIKNNAIEIKNKINQIDNTLADLEDKDNLKQKLEKIVKQIKEYEIQLYTVHLNKEQEQETISQINEKENNIKNLTIKKDKTDQQIKQLTDLQKYFNTDFIQYIQQSFLNEIENYLNLYCFEVFEDNIKLNFTKNGLELTIGNKPYSYFSGGERQRIDFLFVFAIKIALSTFTDKCTNLLIFDESLSGSDAQAFEKSVELLNNLSISSDLITILVSHRKDVTNSINKIIIERYDNKTELKIIE